MAVYGSASVPALENWINRNIIRSALTHPKLNPPTHKNKTIDVPAEGAVYLVAGY